MVVTGGLWANHLGAGTQGIVSLVLTVPFIFLSGYAGQIADKFSKRRVIWWVKAAEIPIALFALLGLLLGSFWLSLIALLLLAVQSSFYGPAKFGVIPDLVGSKRLSQANGLINAISNVAVILGSMAAGPLADLYYPTITNEARAELLAIDEIEVPLVESSPESQSFTDEELTVVPDPNRNPQRLPVGIALLGVALIGLGAATLMPKMSAAEPDLKMNWDLLGPHIQTFKDANRPLIVVLFSWSGFYLIGALALLQLPEYRGILGINNTQVTNLVGLLAVSIMLGSCLVGFISGKTIRPYFSLAGAIGMTVCFAIMGAFNLDYTALAIVIFLVGIFAGFYIVPLQALLQFLSPADERGRFFGTANTLSFIFVSIAGVLFILLAKSGLPPARIPLVCGALALIGTIVGASELKRIMAAQKTSRIELANREESADS
jgi:acyl-[acyl-carrier-protein]-phospholipid O-acyltransferase/long-chain-fatty-acid--[acyl-carrier-protein] ligase